MTFGRIGDPTRDPPIAPIIPVGKSTWWQGVREGRYPKPIKIGARATAWRVEDIRASSVANAAWSSNPYRFSNVSEALYQRS